MLLFSYKGAIAWFILKGQPGKQKILLEQDFSQ